MKKNIFLIFWMLIGAGIGSLIAYFDIIPVYWNLIDFLLFIGWLLIVLVLHIIIHELGHFLFGRLSGYRFLFIRFFSLGLFKQDGKYRFFRLSVPGTAGQCVMIPSENSFHFKLYLLGGGLANLIVSLLILAIGDFYSIYRWAFVLIGVLLAITNLIPAGFNDGMSYRVANSSPEQAYLLYLQLKTVQLSTEGIPITEFPEVYFDKVPPIPKQSHFNDWQTFLIVSQKLYSGQWESYCQELEQLWERREELVLPYQIELKKELLFALCLTSPQDERIAQIWQDKIIKQSLKMPVISNKRVEASYMFAVLKNTYAAQAILKEAKPLALKTPFKGEAQVELVSIEKLRRYFESVGDKE